MAEKRMVHRNITKSDKLLHIANTRGWRACFFYAAHIPFLDKAGRMKANPLGLKGTIWEVHPVTVEELAGDLDALANVGLIRLYRTPKGELVMQYAKFDEEHGGFNKPHPNEPESEYPDPDSPGCRDERVSAVVGNVTDNVVTNVPPQRSDKVASEYEIEKEKEKEKTNPPLTPPTRNDPPPDPPDEEAAAIAESLGNHAADTRARRRQATRYASTLLSQQHAPVREALDDLQGAYAWKPNQFHAIADTVLAWAREHGTDRVAAALHEVLTTGATITHPIKYAKALLYGSPKAATPAPNALPPRVDLDLDAIFGTERPVN